MTEPLVHIIDGRPTEGELAALMALLAVGQATGTPNTGAGGDRVTWRRHEHGAVYRSPTSWR